jgi:Ni,Fe-hydrogenase maturation factor
VVEAQGLVPEIADEIARAETVVFLDADASADQLIVTNLDVSSLSGCKEAHSLTPEALLSLARQLYNATPIRAMLVSIPAYSFAFGETLSPRTRTAVDDATALASSIIVNAWGETG